MRALDAQMRNALAAQTRRPAFTLTIEDHTNHLTAYQAPGLADMWSDCCVASDGSIVRVNLTRGAGGGFGNTFQFARITDPSVAAQWASVTAFSGGSGMMFQDGGCCVSNNAGVLRAFAQQGSGGNAILAWTSTTSGASWTGPTTVVSPPGGALTKGMGSAGNNDIFFIYDVLGGDDLGACFFNGTAWSALSNWGFAHLSAGSGIAAYWTGSQYTIAYSDSATLGGAKYDHPGVGGAWSLTLPIAPATSTAVARVSPRLSFYDGLYHLICNERDTGAISGSVYSYCRVRESADFIHWSDGWLLHDVSTSFGGNVFFLAAPQTGSSGPRYYFSSPATVLSTPAFSASNATQFLDVSAAVLSYRRSEKMNLPATLEVVLDNGGGAYNALLNLSGTAPFQPITPHASIKLGEGYLVGTPPVTRDVIPSGTYRLERVEIERSPQQNQLKITGVDLSSQLDRLARWQNTYSGQTVQSMLLEVCARAGLFNVNLSAGGQLGQTIPTFLIQAGLSYRRALDSLCGTYGLDYFLDQAEVLQIREVLPTDPSVWAYQPEIELVNFAVNYQRANHVIVSGKPPVGGSPLSLTTWEAYDDPATIATRVERILHHVDLKITSVAQCQIAAGLVLYAQQRAQVQHTVVVPLHPALQLADCLTLVDSAAPIGSGQGGIARIIAHDAMYNAQQARYESHLHLQGR